MNSVPPETLRAPEPWVAVFSDNSAGSLLARALESANASSTGGFVMGRASSGHTRSSRLCRVHACHTKRDANGSTHRLSAKCEGFSGFKQLQGSTTGDDAAGVSSAGSLPVHAQFVRVALLARTGGYRIGWCCPNAVIGLSEGPDDRPASFCSRASLTCAWSKGECCTSSMASMALTP